MGLSSFLRSPKHEEEEQEQQVPHDPETIHDIMDDLEGFLGIEDEDEDEKFLCNNVGVAGGWGLMEWEEFAREEGLGHGNSNNVVVKSENGNVGFWDEDEEKRLCLNLNLNYQDVMDAWSDRGSLWAQDCPLSMSFPSSTNGYYMGEVPVMEEEASNRREASVLRYKEKRQCRLFSKKIRYQVRKLNADKRPRLKGRFVKRGGSEM